MKITYEDHMGSDLKTVNMARVSFNKRSIWETTPIYDINNGIVGYDKSLSAKDQSLIDYLAKHKHWAPFAHNVVTVHVKAPIAIARQLFKHKIAFIESEVSRRYISDDPEVFIPEQFRNRPLNKKQGSDDDFGWIENADATEIYQGAMSLSLNFYKELLDKGVAPEQARLVLPGATMTEWFLTGSLPAFHRMYNLRVSEDAQKETCELVKQLDPIMNEHYPLSWEALKKYA